MEMIADGNLNPHEEIKHTGNGNYMKRHERSLKCILLRERANLKSLHTV